MPGIQLERRGSAADGQRLGQRPFMERAVAQGRADLEGVIAGGQAGRGHVRVLILHKALYNKNAARDSPTAFHLALIGVNQPVNFIQNLTEVRYIGWLHFVT